MFLDCVLKMKEGEILTFSFKNEYDYYIFLFEVRNDVLWAKLINTISGEIIDEYVNIKTVSPEILKINITKDMLPNTKTAILINRQKLYWFINMVQRYSKKTSNYIKLNPINFVRIQSKQNQTDGFFIPNSLILISKEELIGILKMLSIEFDGNKYKKRILSEFVDLNGYEININHLLPKNED